MPNRFISCLQSNLTFPMQKAAKGLLVLAACATLATSQPSSSPAKLSSKELLTIVQRHEKLLFQYSDNPDKFENQKLSDRMDNIANAYASFNDNNPKDVFGYVLHGKFLREIGRNPDAYKIFQKAYELDPNLAVVNQQLGNHHAENGRFREAYQHFTKAAKLDPSVAVYHYQLGAHLIYFSKPILAESILTSEQYDKTLMNSLAEAVRLDPQNRSYRTLQAEAYYELNKPDWETALKTWSALLTTGIPDLETQMIQFNRAKVLHQLKRDPEARLLLSEVTLPAFSKSKDELLQQVGGSSNNTEAPLISTTVPTTPQANSRNEELLKEIATLRKELEVLKAAPVAKATTSASTGANSPEVIALRQEVQRLAKLNEESTKLVQTSSQQSKQQAVALQDLQKELEDATKQLKHKETSITAIQKNLKTYASNNADLYKQLQSAKKQNEDLQKQISQNPPTPSSNNLQVSNIQAELAKERQTNKALKEQVATFKSQAEKLRVDFEKADKEVTQLSLHLDGQNKQTQAHLAKAQTLEQENAELKKRLSASGKAISPAETSKELAAKEAELSKLKNDLVKLQRSLAAATTNGFSSMTKDIETVAQLAQVSKDRDTKAAELAEVEKKLNQITKVNTELADSGKQTADDLKKSRTANSLLKEKLDEVLAGSNQLDRQIQSKNKELDIHSQTIKTLKEQLARTEDLLETKEDSLEQLQKNSDALVIASQKKSEQLQKENEDLSKVLNEKDAKHATELAKLRQSLSAQMKKGEQYTENEAILKLAQKDLKERDDKIGQLNKNISDLNKLIKSEQAQTASMEKQNADLLSQIKTLAKTKKDLDAKNAELDNLSKELTAQSKLLNSTKKQSADLIAQMESVKSAHALEIAKLNKNLAAAQKGSETQMASSKAVESALEAARKELGAKDEEVKKLTQLVNTSKKEHEELLAQLETTRKSHTAELAKLTKSLAAAEKGTEAQMASGKEMEAALAKAKKDLDSVKAAHAEELAKVNKSLQDVQKSGQMHLSSNKALEEALDKANKELESKEGELEKLATLVGTSEKEYQELLAQLESTKKAHAAELVKMNKSLEAAEKSGTAQMAESKVNLAELDKARKDLDSKTKELETLTKLSEQSKKEKSDLQTQVSSQKTAHAAAIAKLNVDLQDAMNSRESQEAKSKEALANLYKAQQDLAAKSAALTELKKKMEEVAKANDELPNLKKKLEDSDNAHQALAAELAGKVEALKEQENANKTLQKEFDALTAKLKLANQSDNERGQEMNKLEAELAQTRKDLEDKGKTLSKVQKDTDAFIKNNQKKIQELEKQKTDLLAQIQSRKTNESADLTKLREELAEAKKTGEAQMEKSSETNAALAKIKKEVASKDAELAKLKTNADKLEKTLESTEKEADALGAQLEEEGKLALENKKKVEELEKLNKNLLAELNTIKDSRADEIARLEESLSKAYKSGETQMAESTKAVAELSKAQEELASKDSVISEIQKKLDSFDQEKSKILAAQKDAEEKLASAQSAITQMEKVMDLNDNASKVLTTELVLKIEKIREQEKANKELQKQLDDVAEQLKLVKSPDNSTKNKKMEQLQGELATVRQALEEKEKALASVEKENRAIAASSKGQLDAFEKKNAILIKQMESNKDAHTVAVAKLEASLADITEKLQEAQKAKPTEDPEMENELAQVKSKLTAANLQIVEKQKAINSLLDENSELNTLVQKYKNQPGNKGEEVQLLAEQSKLAELKNNTLQEELAKQKKEIRFLESELTLLEDNLLKQLNTERQSKQKIENLEQSLKQAQETVATLQKPSVGNSPSGLPAATPQMQEELAKQMNLVQLKEKQLAELNDALSLQSSKSNAAQASLQETVDRLGKQLSSLEAEKEILRSQLVDSNKTVSSLKEQLEGNPYATLPSAPLARTAPDQDLQVKLDLAKANEEELRSRLEQTNEQKLKLSEQLVLTENTLTRTKAQLADSQKKILNMDISSPQETQLKAQLKELETAFATYRTSSEEDINTLQAKLAQANAASNQAPASGIELKVLKTRLQDLITSSARTKETLTRIHSALLDANQQNSDLEAELLRQKHANQKLRQQFNHFPETRSLLSVDTLGTPIEEDARVRKLEIALQKTQTKLDEREKQFENVVSRMNLLIERLKQPR